MGNDSVVSAWKLIFCRIGMAELMQREIIFTPAIFSGINTAFFELCVWAAHTTTTNNTAKVICMLSGPEFNAG